MALYIVETADGGVLVRARNGNHAREFVLCADDAPVHRITEDGFVGVVTVGETDKPEPDESREIDITSLSDKPGTRRYKNLGTGEVRTEHDD